MQQRTAVLVGIGMAACAAAGVILLSAGLAEDQRAERHGYQQALAQQRRAAGRSLPAARTPAPRRGAGELCVRGVEGFAESQRTALPAAGGPDALDVLDDAGRLDVTAFAALSDMALRAERWVEQARGAPALPQRMGRTRRAGVATGAAADAAGEPAWQPLEPARVTCGSGEAYAAVPLDLELPGARPEAKIDAKPEANIDAKPEANPEARPEANVGAKPETSARPEARPGTSRKPGARPGRATRRRGR
jgi:hypothetical protein